MLVVGLYLAAYHPEPDGAHSSIEPGTAIIYGNDSVGLILCIL